VISNAILHLNNDLPVVADLEEMPTSSDRSVRCTNVRTVDGKRPSFVHDPHSTFVLPMAMIRLIEVPVESIANHAKPKRAAPEASAAYDHAPAEAAPDPLDQYDAPDPDELPALPAPAGSTPPPIDEEEPDEDLLARIRSA